MFGSSKAKAASLLQKLCRGSRSVTSQRRPVPRLISQTSRRPSFVQGQTPWMSLKLISFRRLPVDMGDNYLFTCALPSHKQSQRTKGLCSTLFLFCRQNPPSPLRLSFRELFFIPSVTWAALLLPKEDVGGNGLIPAGARGVFVDMWFVRVTPGSLISGTARTLGTRRVWWEVRQRRDTAEYNPQNISHKRL